MLGNRLLFLGVIFHEISHLLACLAFGVKVFRVKLLGDEAFVEHEKPNAWQSVVISLAPFLLGNIVSFLLAKTAFALVQNAVLAAVLFFWLSISLAYHSFPSGQDAKNAFESVFSFYAKKARQKEKSVATKILWVATFPFVFAPLSVATAVMLFMGKFGFTRIIWIVCVLGAAQVA